MIEFRLLRGKIEVGDGRVSRGFQYPLIGAKKAGDQIRRGFTNT